MTAPICFTTYQTARTRARGGTLPDAAHLIEGYGQIGELLAAHAERVEPCEAGAAAGRELDRLLALQAAIVTALAARPAAGLHDVMDKLALWSAARAQDGEEGAAEDALVVSALRDLKRLLAAA